MPVKWTGFKYKLISRRPSGWNCYWLLLMLRPGWWLWPYLTARHVITRPLRAAVYSCFFFEPTCVCIGFESPYRKLTLTAFRDYVTSQEKEEGERWSGWGVGGVVWGIWRSCIGVCRLCCVMCGANLMPEVSVCQLCITPVAASNNNSVTASWCNEKRCCFNFQLIIITEVQH